MRVGAVDIGTNSMRLLVADILEGRVAWLDRRVTVTGLGRGLHETGRLRADAVERTLQVLTGYGDALRRAGVEAARAVATSASRDAADRDEFLAAAGRALGFAPDLISGREEASLSFRGAIGGLPDTPAPHLVIDTGGGSTEFVFGTGAPGYLISVDIGSVRLTDRVVPDRPVPEAQLAAAREAAHAALAVVDLPDEPATVIGVAGTFTSLSAISQDLPAYDPGRVHGSRLSLTRLAELVLYLASLSVEETASIPSLDPARAPVLLAGAVIAEEAVRRAGAAGVVVSESDLLDGIALGLAG